jgi:hypothetical protein
VLDVARTDVSLTTNRSARRRRVSAHSIAREST